MHTVAERGATFPRYFEHRRIRVPDFHLNRRKFFRHRPGECASAATEIDDTSVRRQTASEQFELHGAHRFVMRDHCPDEPVVVRDHHVQVIRHGMRHGLRLSPRSTRASGWLLSPGEKLAADYTGYANAERLDGHRPPL